MEVRGEGGESIIFYINKLKPVFFLFLKKKKSYAIF